MDLTSRMRAPELGLEPRPDLADAVRGRARRVRRRRAAGTGLLSVAAVAAALTVLPGVVDRRSTGELATPDRSYGIDDATSSVQRLARINGADVVAYWQDDELCVAAVRIKRDRDCAPGVSPATQRLFPYVFRPDNSALRVDDRQLVAGTVRADVAQVRVVLSAGAPLTVPVRRGEGFLLPVFSAELPRGAALAGVQALDAAGAELAP